MPIDAHRLSLPLFGDLGLRKKCYQLRFGSQISDDFLAAGCGTSFFFHSANLLKCILTPAVHVA